MEYTGSLRITTPEGLAVDLSLAGIGSRFMATALDVLIQGVTGTVGALALAALFEGGVLALFYAVGLFLVLFGYDVAFEMLNNGRTPGKQAAGLRVVRDDGTPITFVASAIRNILRLVDFLPSFYGVAMLSIFLTRRQQRLGDLAAGTLVIRDQNLKGWSPGTGHEAGDVRCRDSDPFRLGCECGDAGGAAAGAGVPGSAADVDGGGAGEARGGSRRAVAAEGRRGAGVRPRGVPRGARPRAGRLGSAPRRGRSGGPRRSR